MMYALAKRFFFRLDPEKAHDVVTAQMERVQGIPPLLSAMAAMHRRRTPGLRRELFGLRFENPLGIAAGFDKDARLVPFLAALGFGFVEVGTVTLHPQPGNPKPRMFRYPEERAIINRLGFNNRGARAMQRELDALWRSPRVRDLPPLFVNIGKNKEVSLEDAPEAYADCYRMLGPLADAVVVNVSSPNTPGLRDLQRASSLRAILEALRNERLKMKPPRGGDHPILVKIAPDLAPEELFEIAMLCLELADGITATNTTVDRAGWKHPTEIGGLSGAPLFQKSTGVLTQLRTIVGPEFPIVGVGGVEDGKTAKAKLDAGASLLQAYTGFIYGGPAFATRVLRELEHLQTRNPKPETRNEQQ